MAAGRSLTSTCRVVRQQDCLGDSCLMSVPITRSRLIEDDWDTTSQRSARTTRPLLKDIDVLTIARRDQRIVITNDPDFGELVVRKSSPHAGVILLGQGAVMTPDLIARRDEVFAHHGHLMGALLIVSRKRVRVRRTSV